MSSQVAQYYDLLSPDYDNIAGLPEIWKSPIVIAKKVQLLINKSKTWLDIGIGTGLLQERVKYDSKAIEIYGIDISEKMYAICQQKFPSIKLQQGDFENIDFPHNYFDIITACGAIEFMPNLDNVLLKIKKLLRPKGTFLFTYEPQIIGHKIQGEAIAKTLPRHSKYYVDDFYTYRHSPQHIISMLETSGFKCIDDIEFVAYSKLDTDIICHLIETQKESDD